MALISSVKTGRLLIRELNQGDAGDILRLTNDPSFMSNIGDKGVRTLDEAGRFIQEGTWTNQKLLGYGQFGVTLREEGAFIGICGLLYRESLGLTDVGFALLPEYRGKGYAFEAARAIVEYGYSILGLDSISGLTAKDNIPSIKVLEKLGMRFQKTMQISDEDPGTALYG